MLPIGILFTTLVLGFAAAQNSTSNFDATTVDPTLKNQWCTSQTNTCFELCGGRQYTKPPTCDPMSLNYNCTCQNGQTPPNLSQYKGTLPFLECQYTFIQCNTKNPGSDQCNNNCGNLDPSSVKAGAGAASTSKAAASSTSATSGTTAAAPAPTTAGRGAAGRSVPEFGVAAVVVGAMGILL